MAARDRTDELPDGTGVRPTGQEPGSGTRIIDLTVFDAPPAGGAAPVCAGAHVRRSVGSRPTVAVAVVTALALLAIGAFAAVTYQRAVAWREVAISQRARATALEQQVEETADVVVQTRSLAATAERERDAALARGEQVAGQLGTSEEDVIALEARITALANEKARLEDELVVSERAAGAAVAGCLAKISAWVDRAPEKAPSGAWETWAADAAGWEATCERVTTH